MLLLGVFFPSVTIFWEAQAFYDSKQGLFFLFVFIQLILELMIPHLHQFVFLFWLILAYMTFSNQFTHFSKPMLHSLTLFLSILS